MGSGKMATILRTRAPYNVMASSISLFSAITAFGQAPITVVSPSQYEFAEAARRNNFTQPLRYQQVYPASDFDDVEGSHEIVEIAWRPDASGAPVEWSVADVQIRLSITSRSSGDLSSVFEQNIESDPVLVLDGSFTSMTDNLGPAGGPKEFDMVLPLETPFVYDPDEGNLLIDIISRSGWSVAPGNDGFDSPQVSILALGGPDAASGRIFGGMVNQFTFVPLPATVTGDYNQNGLVEQADLDLVLLN
jgi:hypothetical protein